MITHASVVTGTGVYPAPKNLTGTISTQAVTKMIKVTGGNSAQINPTLIGKWIYANNQCRKITGVRDGVFIYLEKPFTAAVTGAALNIVDNIGGQVSFVNLSTNTISVCDGSFGAGVGNSFLQQPIWYVLGANQIQIEIQYF